MSHKKISPSLVEEEGLNQSSETQRAAAQDETKVKNPDQSPEDEKILLGEDKSIVIDSSTPIDQKQSEEIQNQRAQVSPKFSELAE